MSLSLYLVTRTDRSGAMYDACWGFVVVSPDIPTARLTCAFQPGDEGPDVWADPARSSIMFLGFAAPDVPTGVVLRDFMAG